MARAIWNGAISFGLVNIPVGLYAAEDRRSFQLAMLDKRDFSPVGYPRTGSAAKEREFAQRLVDGMTQRFDPAKFKDSYHDDLMKCIRQKVRQRQTKVITESEETEEASPRSAKVIDLAALLRQSLEQHAQRGRKSPVQRAVAATKARDHRAVALPTHRRKRA